MLDIFLNYVHYNSILTKIVLPRMETKDWRTLPCTFQASCLYTQTNNPSSHDPRCCHKNIQANLFGQKRESKELVLIKYWFLQNQSPGWYMPVEYIAFRSIPPHWKLGSSPHGMSHSSLLASPYLPNESPQKHLELYI